MHETSGAAVTVRLVYSGSMYVETTATVVDSPAALHAWANAARRELHEARVDEPWHATLEVLGPLTGVWCHPVHKGRAALIQFPRSLGEYRGELLDVVWKERFYECVAAVEAEAARAAARR